MRLPIGSSSGHSARAIVFVDHHHRRPSEAIVGREQPATAKRRLCSVVEVLRRHALVVGEHRIRSAFDRRTSCSRRKWPVGTDELETATLRDTRNLGDTIAQRLEERPSRLGRRVVRPDEGLSRAASTPSARHPGSTAVSRCRPRTSDTAPARMIKRKRDLGDDQPLTESLRSAARRSCSAGSA